MRREMATLSETTMEPARQREEGRHALDDGTGIDLNSVLASTDALVSQHPSSASSSQAAPAPGRRMATGSPKRTMFFLSLVLLSTLTALQTLPLVHAAEDNPSKPEQRTKQRRKLVVQKVVSSHEPSGGDTNFNFQSQKVGSGPAKKLLNSIWSSFKGSARTSVEEPDWTVQAGVNMPIYKPKSATSKSQHPSGANASGQAKPKPGSKPSTSQQQNQQHQQQLQHKIFRYSYQYSKHHGQSDVSRQGVQTRRRLLLEVSLHEHYMEHADLDAVPSSPSDSLSSSSSSTAPTTPTSESSAADSGSLSRSDQAYLSYLLDPSDASWEERMELPFRYAQQHSMSSILGMAQRRDPMDAGRDSIICYYYSESPNAYWTFRYCPNYFVQQGVRSSTATNPDASSMKIHQTLGMPPSQLDPATINVDDTDASHGGGHQASTGYRAHVQSQSSLQSDEYDRRIQSFQNIVKTQYPHALRLDMYTHGDVCQLGDQTESIPRITAIIFHRPGSTINCPQAMADSLQLPGIESVDETHACQYIVHICPPTDFTLTDEEVVRRRQEQEQQRIAESLVPQSTDDTSSGAGKGAASDDDSGRERTKMQHALHTYMHQSEVDHHQKSHPDRITSLQIGMPPIPQSRVDANRDLVKNMFEHAYDNYMYHAYPGSEIKPITCKPTVFDLIRLPALTLIDSLDTLIIMQNYTEFARSVERLKVLDQQYIETNRAIDRIYHRGGIFAFNQNVSVFETNIRVLGGLLSAHQLAEAYMLNKVHESEVLDEHGAALIGVAGSATYRSCDGANAPASQLDHDVHHPAADQQCVSAGGAEECQATYDAPTRIQKHQQHQQQEQARLVNNNNSNSNGGSNGDGNCRNVTSEFWRYDGYLLRLAQDIGNRLYPVFKTKTGIPYGTVNLLAGIPDGETPIASLAGGGTLSLEMELLSRLTGNKKYGRAAKLSTRALWMRSSDMNLYGKHICTNRGRWTETLSGIGSNSDSFLEYLIKHHALFHEDADFWPMMYSAYGGVHNNSRLGEWYPDVDMSVGVGSNNYGTRKIFEALMAFYPGMQVLLGELEPAARSLNSYFLAREFLGFLPERFHFAQWKVDGSGGEHFLRPELLESAYFLHRSTKSVAHPNSQSSGWQWASDFALHALEKVTKSKCGYASLKDVAHTTTGASRAFQAFDDVKLKNEMPSFFLSETLKYLYLTFDEDNLLHADTTREWVFTTEAHPIHSVPIPEEQDRKRHMRDLAGRLKAKLRKQTRDDASNTLASSLSLDQEVWADSSSVLKFVTKLQSSLGDMAIPIQGRQQRWLQDQERRLHDEQLRTTAPLPSRHHDWLLQALFAPTQVFDGNDNYAESQNHQNLAHVGFKKRGRNYQPGPVCLNHHSLRLAWMKALHGGSLDYNDFYLSTLTDELGETQTNHVVFGSAESLNLLLGGLYGIASITAPESCPVGASKAQTKSQSQQQTTQPQGKASSTGASDNGINRYDLGAELGSFDVSAFPGGSGFYIQNVASEESVTVSLLDELASDGAPDEHLRYMLIDAKSNRAGGDREEGEEKTHEEAGGGDSATASETATAENDAPQHRTSAISTFEGEVFFCQIELIQKNIWINSGRHHDDIDIDASNGDDGTPNGHDKEKEEVLAVYPCAPAMFGPTKIQQLVEVGEVVLELPLRKPTSGNEYGCVPEHAGDGHGNGIDNDSAPNRPSLLNEPGEAKEPSGSAADSKADQGIKEPESRVGTQDGDHAVIHMVRRGMCPFQEKAANFQQVAGGLIVVNSDADDLFVMSEAVSGSTNANDNEDSDGDGANSAGAPPLPTSVLVTGSDGEDIIRRLNAAAELMQSNANENDPVSLVARISLVQQNASVVRGEKIFHIQSTDHWPVVLASEEAVQVFAKGGWAVHAAKQNEDTTEWQLYLMKHGATSEEGADKD